MSGSGVCGSCRKRVGVRNDGTIGVHGGDDPSVPCDGAGSVPVDEHPIPTARLVGA